MDIEFAMEGLIPNGADELEVGCKLDSETDCEKSKAGDCIGAMGDEGFGFRSISKVAERGECDAEWLAPREDWSWTVDMKRGHEFGWKEAR